MNRAHIEAVFADCDGQTRAKHLRQSAPLKVARTFPLENGAIKLCLMDSSPGMLAGDRYNFDFTVEKGARVEVTTQGFTRVHPSRDNGCELQTNLKVEANAQLEWFPEPLMLYADADLNAQATVNLAPNSTFLASDTWCAGRIGRGEVWDFARHRNRWIIKRDNMPIYAGLIDINPRNFNVRQSAAWGNYTHSGSFWAFCSTASGAVATDFEALLCQSLWEIIERQPTTIYAGASVLAHGGVIVSMLGNRAHDLQELTSLLRAQTQLMLRNFG